MRRLLLILVLLGGLAACDRQAGTGLPTARGGGSAAPSASPSASKEPDLGSFVQCLRAHGLNIPAGDKDHALAEPATAAERAAWKACRQLLPAPSPEDFPSAQDLEKMRAFAACMRQHDVPMDDPVPNVPGGGKMAIHGRFEHITRAQLDADPAWKAALAACRSRLPDDQPDSPNYDPQQHQKAPR